MNPTEMDASVWLPIVDNSTYEGPRRLRLKLKSLSPQFIIEGSDSCLLTIEDNDNAAGPARVMRRSVDKIAAASESKWLIGGAFNSVDGQPRAGLARLLQDQALDTSFDVGTGANGPVRALAEAAGGGAWLAGAFSQVDGIPRAGVARLLPNGRIDPGFLPPRWGNSEVTPNFRHLAAMGDGSIIVAGVAQFERWGSRVGVVKFRPTGLIDASYEVARLPLASISAFGVLPDGSALVVGRRQLTRQEIVLRLAPDGRLQEDFELVLDGIGAAILSAPDGVVWIGSGTGLIRFESLPASARGVSANSVGRVVHPEGIFAADQMPDGKVLFTGFNKGRRSLVCLNPDGTPYELFSPVYDEFQALAVDHQQRRIAAAPGFPGSYPPVGLLRFDFLGRRVRDLTFSGIALPRSSEVHLSFRGQVGVGAGLEVSPKLETSTDLKTWFGVSGPWVNPELNFVHTNLPPDPRRFYRLRR